MQGSQAKLVVRSAKSGVANTKRNMLVCLPLYDTLPAAIPVFSTRCS